MREDAIAAEILAMVERDQGMRKRLLNDTRAFDATIDRENTRRLQEIVAEIGWPTRTRVGLAAEDGAWLLIQHADHDRVFQRYCLELMRAQPPTEVCPKHLAYLEDRITVGEGRAQRFGTQLRKAGGGYEAAPIEDPERVDELRAGVGLGPLAEYLANVSRWTG
ncbi:MAG TPA: DUF6624 domain-containing protein [Candidatus Limnocylindria bacterium]|nr:DUF6624 domain-containing protein [Candidatus Limnocylindria bacterium]